MSKTKMLQFSCPNCGCHEILLQIKQLFVSIEIAENLNEINGEIEESYPEGTDEYVVEEWSCADCYYPIWRPSEDDIERWKAEFSDPGLTGSQEGRNKCK